MDSSSRYLGTAVGFGFGVVWMTVGAGSAVLVVLCAALGYAVVYVAERERSGAGRLRPARRDAAAEDLLVDDYELELFERRDEEIPHDDLSPDEMVSVSTEPDYGWPHP